jgi:hypothetical protein
MTLPTYKAYVFRTKDPAIDELRTVVEDHFGHRVTNKDLKAIEEDGGPKLGTMRGWFFGKTRRPQNPTLEAAGRALGYQRKWVKMNGTGRK